MVEYAAGEVVQRREVLHGQVWLEHPVTIVSDRDGIRIWKDVEDLHHQRVEGRIDLDTVGRVLAAAVGVSALLDSDRRWWQPWDDWTP